MSNTTAGVITLLIERTAKLNFAEQMQAIFEDYQAENGSGPVELDEVAEWALSTGRFFPSPKSVRKICRDALAESLRQEKRVDAAGREYRAKHCVRQSSGGRQLHLWADIDTAPRAFMVKSFGQRRKAIANDCFQLKQDVDHFNEESDASDIQLIMDFSDDVAEMEASRGQGDKAA